MSTQAIQRTTSVKALVESPAYSKRIRELLGERAPELVTSLIHISQQWQLSKCDPDSIIAAGLISASLNLPVNPNLGFAYVVPYGDKAQLQIGYKGFVQLAMRTGQYKLLNVTEIYEGELVSNDRLKGELKFDHTAKKSDKVIGVAAYMALVNGFEHAEFWTTEVIMAHAEKFSQAYRAKKKDSPWFTNPMSMMKKTVLKAMLSHWGPMSIQMNKALEEDQGAHTNVESTVIYPDNPDGEIKPGLLGAPREGETGEGNAMAGSATTATAPAAAPEFDATKPYEEVKRYCARDGVTEEQVMLYCKSVKLAKADQEELPQLASAKLVDLLTAWKSILNNIKAQKPVEA